MGFLLSSPHEAINWLDEEGISRRLEPTEPTIGAMAWPSSLLRKSSEKTEISYFAS
jgi:hypothetical protein